MSSTLLPEEQKTEILTKINLILQDREEESWRKVRVILCGREDIDIGRCGKQRIVTKRIHSSFKVETHVEYSGLHRFQNFGINKI